MRRLPVARDRELRHVAAGNVAWRWNWNRSFWYPWCRLCGRDVRARIDRLIGSGYVELINDTHVSFVNAKPTALADTYLERYPR